jgi:acyl-CoA synthetase (AMP-forming)/AMP-acid ligase II/alkylation response protein AidB-like acyl-CoA dehydrogenase/acyl carrier protein
MLSDGPTGMLPFASRDAAEDDRDESIVSRLFECAVEHPGALAFGFCETTASAAVEVDYGTLCRRVAALASHLAGRGLGRRTCLLLYPAGLDFVVAFLACLAAGVIAVPVSSGRSGRSGGVRLAAIARDAQASAILVPRRKEALPGLDEVLCAISPIDCIETGLIAEPATAFVRPERCRPADIAFLQYTSGSTAAPKGVVVSHGNLMANARAVRTAFSVDGSSRLVCWLPHFHDLGLIGNLLQTVYAGASCLLLAPSAFARHPIGWLRLIDRFGGTVSMAPNFAFAMCVERATPASIEGLDLSRLRTLINASEPVRHDTMTAFSHAFAPCGFDPGAFRVAYGLAESTLVVTAGHNRPEPWSITVGRASLARGSLQRIPEGTPAGRTIVSTGVPCGDLSVIIVDPVTSARLPDEQVGEVWLRGAAVCRGYRQAETDAAHTFDARTRDGEGGYLRTGDLGARLDGELFITGRLKETLIVRGANHYPQDIEHSVQQACPDFRVAGGAAFLADDEGSARLIVVQEIERGSLRQSRLSHWASRLRQRVWEDHGLAVSETIFVPPFTVPKTSSGKIQRRLCREWWRDKTLPALEESRSQSGRGEDVDAICTWLQHLARRRVNFRLMDERRAMSPYLVLELGNRGMLGLERPRSEGGAGLSVRQALDVIEQMAALDLSAANFLTLQNALVLKTLALAKRPPEELARFASGRALGAFAMTEPEAGSNYRGIQTVAREVGPAEWALHGEKIWIGNAGWAQSLLVFAMRVGLDGSALGVTCFLVPADAEGVLIEGEHLTMGLRSMVQNTVRFIDVRVSAAHVVGSLDFGLNLAQEAMMHTRLYIAAGSVGALRRSVQWMVRYASRRRIMSQSLMNLPAVHRRIHDAACRTEAVSVIVQAVAERLDANRPVAPELNACCKVLGPETLWRVLDDLAQVLGGRGYIESNFVPRMIRDARVLRVFEGPSETLLAFIGSAVRAHPEPLLEFIEDDLRAPGNAAALLQFLRSVERPVVDQPARQLSHVHLMLGTIATQTILLAALGRIPEMAMELDPSACVECVARELESARRELDDRLRRSDEPDIAALDSLAGRYEHRLGQLSISPQEEVVLLDDYLRPGTASSARADEAKATIAASTPPTIASQADSETPMVSDSAVYAEFIRHWIQVHFSRLPESDHLSFSDMGLDSISAVELTFDLGHQTGIDLDPTLLWFFPTIAKLSEHVAELADLRRTAGDRL